MVAINFSNKFSYTYLLFFLMRRRNCYSWFGLVLTYLSTHIVTVSEFNNISAWIFTEEWKSRDESHNKEQRYDEEMIREVKRNEVEEEIRKQVDNLMREELDLLKIVSF